MFSRKKTAPPIFKVTLTKDGIIHTVTVGYLTADVMRKGLKETEAAANKLKAEGREVLVLSDLHHAVGQSSEARTLAKNSDARNFDRLAFFGGNRVLATVVQYILKTSGSSKKVRFFRTETQAAHWLLHGDQPKVTQGLWARSITAVLVAAISISALAGWVFDIPQLDTIVPGLKAMNPIGAINFLLLAIALVLLHTRRLSIRRKVVIGAIAGWSNIFGLLVLLRYFSSMDINVDGWLFADKLGSSLHAGQTAPSTALSMLLIAGMLGFAVSIPQGQKKTWRHLVFYGLYVLAALISLGAVVGYAYGYRPLYTLGASVPMPLGTAITCLIFLYGLRTVASMPLASLAKAGRIGVSYWQAIVVFLIFFLATGVVWQQSKSSTRNTVQSSVDSAFKTTEAAIKARVEGYVNALEGFRALFAASSDVEPDEFQSYFAASDVATRYPGLGAITFVAAVPKGSEQAFIAKTRDRATSDFPQYKAFTIFPKSQRSVVYPLLYTEPQTSVGAYGFDLGSENMRLKTLERARDSGQAAASGVIDLNASKTLGESKNGFFISLPVYSRLGLTDTRSRQADIVGFVVAYFEDTVIFADMFKPFNEQGARYVVTDEPTKIELYQSRAHERGWENTPQGSSTIDVAGGSWRLNMYLGPHFRQHRLEESIPMLTLIGGLVLTGLATLLVVNQLRARNQALELASDMTEDLNNERDTAISNQQKDDAILSSIGDAVFVVDAHGKVTIFNRVAEQISGYSANEVIGKSYKKTLQFMASEKSTKTDTVFVEKMLSNQSKPRKDQTILVRKDTRRVLIAATTAPIKGPKGEVIGAIVIFRDVTKEKEIDRMKTEFISLASHQLRTPLSAIKWFSEMLVAGDAGKLNAEQADFARNIFDSTERMVELVNSLLNISRIESGRIMIVPKPTDLSELLAGIVTDLKAKTEERKQTLIISVHAGLPKINLDARLIGQVYQNLLTNAIKYTPKGGEISVFISKKDNQVITQITDNGYGIPKAQQGRVFEKFFRAENVAKVETDGNGLGLYLIKAVVESSGGKIWFKSEENKGTTFWFSIPLSGMKAKEGEVTLDG